MMNKLVMALRESVLFRRLLGFVWHTIGIIICYIIAFQVRYDFGMDEAILQRCYQTIPIVLSVYLICILAFGLYKGLWRFFTFRDSLQTGIALLAGTLIIGLVLYFWNGMSFELYPRSVLLINYLLLLGWEVGGRGFVRVYREWYLSRDGSSGKKSGAVIVGNPEGADVLIRSLANRSPTAERIVAIVTGNKGHNGAMLRGVPMYSGLDRIGKIVYDTGASVLLFLPPFTAPKRIREVMGSVSGQKLSCEYRVIPSLEDMTSGKLNVSNIRRVEIVDLLQREPYSVDRERVRSAIEGKRVLVTGAGGSIGSEICRQVLELSPISLTLVEISEYLLFEIERELSEKATESEIDLIGVTADVRRPEDIRAAIAKTGGVDIIYHAAAYKHVGLMERNPIACFQNNVIGTATMALVAEEEGVEQFVLISSDKAVRPTSLMGASKRLAERVIIERPKGGTRFKAVRFGNVLGSSGSVVPIFKEQISRGGPVTVTSRNVTRYFMTIPEAVELVLVAGAVAEDRRICLLEMGDSVKIDDLARRMIELSGFVPDVDVQIEYTGLKPGEKEYEELLTSDEGVVRTDHDRIWVVKANDGSLIRNSVDLGILLELVDGRNEAELRRYIHSLIPGSLLLP